MSKSLYCVGKLNGEQSEYIIAESSLNKLPAKRVNIVSIKMVRDGSILYGTRTISTPSEAAELGRRFIEDADREQLLVCCLDTKNMPNSISIVSVGTLNSSLVHPREVFKVALLSNAASVILFHNHPSSDINPSSEDINVTKRLKEAAKILGVDMLDHIIIGGEGRFCSLKEKGII